MVVAGRWGCCVDDEMELELLERMSCTQLAAWVTRHTEASAVADVTAPTPQLPKVDASRDTFSSHVSLFETCSHADLQERDAVFLKTDDSAIWNALV